MIEKNSIVTWYVDEDREHDGTVIEVRGDTAEVQFNDPRLGKLEVPLDELEEN